MSLIQGFKLSRRGNHDLFPNTNYDLRGVRKDLYEHIINNLSPQRYENSILKSMKKYQNKFNQAQRHKYVIFRSDFLLKELEKFTNKRVIISGTLLFAIKWLQSVKGREFYVRVLWMMKKQ